MKNRYKSQYNYKLFYFLIFLFFSWWRHVTASGPGLGIRDQLHNFSVLCGKSSWMCPYWGRWASLRAEAVDGWWKKRFACRLKLLDQLKYLEVKEKWSNWETGVDEQIFVVSTRDPSLMKRKLSTLHFWSVGRSWRKKITWLQWCCMDELSLGDRVAS